MLHVVPFDTTWLHSALQRALALCTSAPGRHPGQLSASASPTPKSFEVPAARAQTGLLALRHWLGTGVMREGHEGKTVGSLLKGSLDLVSKVICRL